MPDWIEPISKEKAKSAKTVPEIPIRLPIPAYLNVTGEGIQVHAERTEDPEYGESAEEMDVQFRKQDIVSIAIFLMPPIGDGSDKRNVELTDYSRAVIRHRDPFEVVPYFESTFTCDNDYWLRALAKANKDRLNVKQTFLETKAAS